MVLGKTHMLFRLAGLKVELKGGGIKSDYMARGYIEDWGFERKQIRQAGKKKDFNTDYIITLSYLSQTKSSLYSLAVKGLCNLVIQLLLLLQLRQLKLIRPTSLHNRHTTPPD